MAFHPLRAGRTAASRGSAIVAWLKAHCQSALFAITGLFCYNPSAFTAKSAGARTEMIPDEARHPNPML